MRRTRSDRLQSVGAVWLAALLCLLACHYVLPDDPWATMLARPLSLVLVPLFVASIPLLASMSVAEEADEDDRYSSEGQRGQKWKQRGMLRKMALVWLVSLVVFGAPHTGTPAGRFDYIWHNAVFLVVAPLVLACIPLLGSSLPSRGQQIRLGAADGSSRFQAWKGLVAGAMMAAILLLCLFGVYSMKGATGKLPVYCALAVLLSGDVFVLWKSVKRLRS